MALRGISIRQLRQKLVFLLKRKVKTFDVFYKCRLFEEQNCTLGNCSVREYKFVLFMIFLTYSFMRLYQYNEDDLSI